MVVSGNRQNEIDKGEAPARLGLRHTLLLSTAVNVLDDEGRIGRIWRARRTSTREIKRAGSARVAAITICCCFVVVRQDQTSDLFVVGHDELAIHSLVLTWF